MAELVSFCFVQIRRIIAICESLPFLPLYCFRPRLCPSPAQSLPQPFDREGATKVLENDRVIVWDVSWLQRAYPTHRHLYDYAGVYYTSGDRIIVSPEGVRRPTHTIAWDTFFFRRGVTHSEEGASAEPLRAVFLELKESVPMGAADTASAGLGKKVRESDRLVILKRRHRPRLHGASPGHDDPRASPMSQTARCASASTPSRWSRRRNCCCRNACRAMSRWRGCRRRSQTGAITYLRRGAARRRAASRLRTPPCRARICCPTANYSVMLTAAGGGYSRWRGMAITRWREDPTRDNWGSFIYLRDLRSGEVWSAGYQPRGSEPDSYEADFSEDRATITRSDGALATVMEVAVSPEDDAEVRRISITNNGTRLREIEVTSYMPSWRWRGRRTTTPIRPSPSCSSKPNICARPARCWRPARPRSPSRTADLGGASQRRGRRIGRRCAVSKPTAARFLTRNQQSRMPGGVRKAGRCPTARARCWIPIFSLRRRVQIPRGQTVTIAFWTMAAAIARGDLDLVDRHHEPAAFERATTLAATHAQTQLQYLGIGGGRRASVPAAGQLPDLLPTRPCARRPKCWRAAAPPAAALVAAGHFRRLPDRAGAHQRRGRNRLRARR